MDISKMADSNYIKRNTYLEKLKLYLDKPMIKIITGMRRVGKTVILKLLINNLLNQVVNQNNIVYINKESLVSPLSKNLHLVGGNKGCGGEEKRGIR